MKAERDGNELRSADGLLAADGHGQCPLVNHWVGVVPREDACWLSRSDLPQQHRNRTGNAQPEEVQRKIVDISVAFTPPSPSPYPK